MKPAQTRRAILQAGTVLAATIAAAGETQAQAARSGYATVDGHRIYFQQHGPETGVPIVLLHGGVMSIESAFRPDLLPRFARTRRVIAIEQQGHGHTADRAGPITYARMAADTAGVLDHLGVREADFFGHSMGGGISLEMAITRPERVRTLIALSAGYRFEGMLPELVEMNRNPNHQPSAELIPLLPSQEDFVQWQATYARLHPNNPTALQDVLGKLHAMMTSGVDWTPEQLRSVRAPTLLMFGDKDFYVPEHIADMAALIPNAQLAILPGTTHMSILERGDWILPMVEGRLASRT